MSRNRLYQRNGRYYADLRDFRDVIEEGSGQEALIPEGEAYATKDEETATRLMLDRLDVLRDRRENGVDSDPRLGEYAAEYLERREAMGTVRKTTLKGYERRFRHVVQFMEREEGTGVRLSEVTVDHLRSYWRERLQGGEIGPAIQKSTLRNELISLSTLYKAAVKDGKVANNPVRRLDQLPRGESSERTWLEVEEGAALLKAAKEMTESSGRGVGQYFHALLATLLLTGGRKTEVFGLQRREVDFKHDEVHFRENDHRRLKWDSHKRVVPMWPQLKEILAPYVLAQGIEEGLLFPSRKTGDMLTDIADGLETALERAEIDKHVTLHTFRHTYTATRMQTLDHGYPVSPYTVMRELGHKDLEQIMETYGHLQKRRSRGEAVEYRPSSGD